MNLVTVSQAQGRVPVTVLHIQDRINMGNSAELEQTAKDAFAAGVRAMVIDLANAPSVTSAGIRAIIIIHNMLSSPKKKTRHLKLANMAPAVREVFDIAGLMDYLEVYDSLDEAVASF